MKRYILSGMIFVCAATPVIAADTAGDPLAVPSAAQPPLFEKVDTNGDGSISIMEAAAINLTSKQFEAVDANKDGLLNKVEYEASKTEKTS